MQQAESDLDRLAAAWKRRTMEMNRVAAMSLLGEEAILTPEHVAVILGCSVRGVATLRRADRLPPAARIGSLIRWPLFKIRMWAQRECGDYSQIDTIQPANAVALRDDALISPEEFAISLGCSVRHLSKLRQADKLPPVVPVGRSLRWRLGDVRTWVRHGWRPGR